MTGSSHPTPRILELLHDIEGIGHPKNPFADAIYGPRVPCCTDFTAFIQQCLADHDTESIIQLAEALEEENPRMLQGIPHKLHDPGLPPRPLKAEWGVNPAT